MNTLLFQTYPLRVRVKEDNPIYKYLSKLSVEGYTPGIYLLSVVVDGAVVETVKLSVNK